MLKNEGCVACFVFSSVYNVKVYLNYINFLSLEIYKVVFMRFLFTCLPPKHRTEKEKRKKQRGEERKEKERKRVKPFFQIKLSST